MLSTLVVTKQLNPDKHDSTGKTNTIIEIPPNVYLSKMRLINVGAQASGGTNVLYPANAGVSQLVHSLSLKSGNQEIARLNEVGQYMGYRYGLKDNAHQQGTLARTALTEMGTNVSYERPTNPWSRGYILNLPFSQGRNQANTADRNQVVSSNNGTLNLNEMLEFLNAQPYLARIPNLRLEIEWNDLTEDNLLVYTTKPTSYSVNRPQLLLEQVVDQAVLDQIPSDFMVEYMNVEVERQRIAKPANNTSISTYKLEHKAFNQKYLKDVVMALRPDTDTGTASATSSGLARNVAFSQQNERYTFQINNMEYLPPDGIDSPGVKMYLNRIARGAISRGFYHYAYAQQDAWNYLGGNKLNQVQRQAYLMLPVEDVINRFQTTLRFQARGSQNQNQWDASDLFLFGRVSRKITVQNGRVLLSY